MLSGLFFVLTLAAYARFAQQPRFRSRGQAIVALCSRPGSARETDAGDAPLRSPPARLLAARAARRAGDGAPAGPFAAASLRAREAAPLGLVAVSALVTYAVQQRGGAMLFAEELSLLSRLGTRSRTSPSTPQRSSGRRVWRRSIRSPARAPPRRWSRPEGAVLLAVTAASLRSGAARALSRGRLAVVRRDAGAGDRAACRWACRRAQTATSTCP